MPLRETTVGERLQMVVMLPIRMKAD